MSRRLVEKLNNWIERDEIIVIYGARQVGKTSLLRYLQKNLDAQGKKTIFVDLEDIELRSALKTARNLIAYLEAVGWTKGERFYVFLDEIHYMENAPSVLKYVHDHCPELKFIITGSSSLKLKFKMGEPLTGRKVVFVLYPLSFDEFLNFTGKTELREILSRFGPKPIPEPLLAQIAAVYEEYVMYGGYPKVALTPSRDMKIQVLKEIQTTYVEREIRSLVAEESYGRFSSLVEYLAAQNGGFVNVTEISKEAGIARETVMRYLSILEETFIVARIKPWTRSRQKEITRMPKLYFLDTGFLNYITKNFGSLSLRPNTGTLVESAILTTLLREMEEIEEVRFWRTKSKDEVDFILRGGKEIIPIEVKWSARMKIPAGLRILLKGRLTQKAFVVVKNLYGEEKINSSIVTFLPPWALAPALWSLLERNTSYEKNPTK
ncbi:MAG: ATP-binding protein [bacterium]